VTDIEDPRLDDLPIPEQPRGNFRVMDYTVHYAGLCATCQNAEGRG
jgi:hypothetical protein